MGQTGTRPAFGSRPFGWQAARSRLWNSKRPTSLRKGQSPPRSNPPSPVAVPSAPCLLQNRRFVLAVIEFSQRIEPSLPSSCRRNRRTTGDKLHRNAAPNLNVVFSRQDKPPTARKVSSGSLSQNLIPNDSRCACEHERHAEQRRQPSTAQLIIHTPKSDGSSERVCGELADAGIEIRQTSFCWKTGEAVVLKIRNLRSCIEEHLHRLAGDSRSDNGNAHAEV